MEKRAFLSTMVVGVPKLACTLTYKHTLSATISRELGVESPPVEFSSRSLDLMDWMSFSQSVTSMRARFISSSACSGVILSVLMMLDPFECDKTKEGYTQRERETFD